MFLALKTSVYGLASFVIDGNGDYNLLLSLLSNLTIIFVHISVLRVLHFLLHLFREIFANMEIPNKFRIKFEYGK